MGGRTWPVWKEWDLAHPRPMRMLNAPFLEASSTCTAHTAQRTTCKLTMGHTRLERQHRTHPYCSSGVVHDEGVTFLNVRVCVFCAWFLGVCGGGGRGESGTNVPLPGPR